MIAISSRLDKSVQALASQRVNWKNLPKRNKYILSSQIESLKLN